MAGPGRQPTPIGAHGKITTVEIGSKLWEARTRFCDADGVLRKVKRQGQSKTAAENNLQKALSDRRDSVEAEITGGTRVKDIADRWLAQFAERVEAGDRSHSSLRDYESAWRLHGLPSLGELRVRDATTARCEAWLRALRKRHGAPICARARRVATGIFGYAVRMGGLQVNPMREVSPIPGAGARTRKPRVMTRAEIAAWLDWLDRNVAHDPSKPRRPELHHRTGDVIASRALGDITRFMLGTGCRIGEAMAVSWDEVDLEARTVYIGWHLIRVKGQGLVRVQGAKSDEGDRLLKVPGWCADMLLRRRTDPNSGYPVFADELGGWRDPNLVMRWLRWSREQAGFDWLQSHVFRQTVITVLGDELKEREVADHAGHSDTAQTRRYIARKVRSDAAAEVLETLLGE